MRTLRQLVFLVALLGITASVLLWRRAESLSAEIAALKTQLAAAQEQAAAEAAAKVKQTDTEISRLRAEAADVQKLRAEIGQLRAGAKDLEKMRAENQQLRTAAQSARTVAPMAPAPAAAPTDFPKESWSNAGYQTPEATLVTSIWAMLQANPKTYLESLTPDEQARALQRWEGKSEAEIATKLQGDVTRIAGLRVNGKSSVSDTEMHMNVTVGGAGGGEQERIARLKLVEGAWKFDGFQSKP